MSALIDRIKPIATAAIPTYADFSPKRLPKTTSNKKLKTGSNNM
jgi:hypothetical protein